MPLDHWLTRGSVYEVFVREFSAEGSFRAVNDRLDEIQDLGVTTIWLMPIHPVGEAQKKGPLGSPYAVRDYGSVNPDFGSEQELVDLIDRAHRLGLRLIIDWVINHTAWDNHLLREHPEFYVRDENGAIKVAGHGWTDVAQLDHSAPGLRRELIRQMLRWVRDFDVDGFRCDVAGLVPTDLWEQAVDILREAKPDLGMLAEAYDRSLMERAFQLTYDGPWFRAVTKKLLKLGGTERMWDKHDQFVHRFPPRAQRLRYLDNHDQQRLVSYLDDDACLAAATLLLTSEGVPLIYNGQEIGSDAPSAAPALFERHPIDWASPRPGFRQHYRQLLQLRNAHPALEIGETQEIDVPHRQVVTFLRTANDEQIFVTINCSPDEIRCQIRHDQLLAVGEILAERHLLHGSTLSDGVADLILGPWGWLIWSNGGW